jgi:hypothetical protein
LTANYTLNSTNSSRTAHITVTVSGLAPFVVTVIQAGLSYSTVNMAILLEGLYAGNGTMNQAMDNNGPHWTSPTADKINVELHDGSNYGNIVYTASSVSLNVNGIASFTVPGTYNGSYYLTITHRNSILTVSSIPVSFASGTVNYNFTDNASKAYGSNLLLMIDGKWTVYGGDVNQDGLVDSGDFTGVDNDATAFVSGYLPTDVNGDGTIDSGDMTILDNNSSAFVNVVTP